MARPRKQPGEIGSVSYRRRGNRVYARTEIRTGTGDLREISGTGVDEGSALADLVQRAEAAWHGALFSPRTPLTVGALAEAWLNDVSAAGVIRQQTIDNYRYLVGNIVNQTISAIPVSQVTVAFAESYLRRLENDTGGSQANKVRVVLKLILDHGIRLGTVDYPVNAFEKTRKAREKPTSYVDLEPGQVIRLMELFDEWGGEKRRRDMPAGSTISTRRIANIVLVMLGCSCRPGEVLALRDPTDLRFGDGDEVDYLDVNGTIVRDSVHGLYRQPMLKAERQRRLVPVPPFAADAIWAARSERISDPARNPDGLLFTSSAGRAIDVNFVGMMLRRFRNAYCDELTEVGIDLATFTARAFRKTAATVVTNAVDIKLAAEFLGHSTPDTTRIYAKPEVPVVREEAAAALQARFQAVARRGAFLNEAAGRYAG